MSLADRSDKIPFDKGYGWIVSVAAMFVNLVTIGLVRSTGIFFYELSELYDASASSVALVFTVRGITATLFGIVAGALSRRYGGRPVVMASGILGASGFLLASFSKSLTMTAFTFGVLKGVAVPFGIPTALNCVTPYFKEKRAIANAVVVAGGSIGQFVMPAFAAFFIGQYSFRGALILLGGVMLQSTVFGALLRPTTFYTKQRSTLPKSQPKNVKSIILTNEKEQIQKLSTKNIQVSDYQESLTEKVNTAFTGDKNAIVNGQKIETGAIDKKKRLPFDCSIFKDISFLLVFIGNIFCTFGYLGTFLCLPPHLREEGYTNVDIAYFLLGIGVCELSSRLLAGFAFNVKAVKQKVRIAFLYGVCAVVSGVAICVFPFVKGFSLILADCIVIGLFGAQITGLGMPLSVEAVGVVKSGAALVYINMMLNLGLTVAPNIIGIFRDMTGNYQNSFYLFGTASVMGGIIILFQSCRRPFVSKDENPADENNSMDCTVNVLDI